MKRYYAAAFSAFAVVLSGCGGTASQNASGFIETGETYAAKLSAKLSCSDYDIKITITGESSADGSECRLVKHGGNGLVSIDKDNVYSEFVTVNGETLMLMPEIQCYRRSGDLRSFGSAFITVRDDDTLFEIEESGGEVYEVYNSSGETSREVCTFVFDKETGELSQVLTESEEGQVCTDIIYTRWESDMIGFPDLSEWDDISDDAYVSDVTMVKFSMYTDGVTPEMVKEAGYDYEELAKLTVEEVDEITADILSAQDLE